MYVGQMVGLCIYRYAAVQLSYGEVNSTYRKQTEVIKDRKMQQLKGN